MNQTLVPFFRCPVCRGEISLWDVREQRESEVIEGALACESCAATYQVHARLPILLPPGRRAVDDFAHLLAAGASKVGFAESVRRLADGETPFPIVEEFAPPITPGDAREAQYRETEAFWDTFSRNRLVQQQLNAIDQHWDALEEVWLRAEVNFAESILDVGTGWGGTLQHLLAHGPLDALVVGCDTAFLNLKVAQGRAGREGFDHAAFVVGDIAVPPFAPGLFDAAVSWFGVGSVPRLRAGLEGVRRVLAPERTFAAAWTPLVNDMEGLAGPDDLARLAEHLDIPTSPEAAAKATEEAGFEDVEITPVGPILVLSGRAPAGAGEDS